MRNVVLVLAACLVTASAVPRNPQRIIGGEITDILEYPYAVALLYSSSGAGNFVQYCGGSILNTRAILSAAHCFYRDTADQWRARVGSTYASSGGTVHGVGRLILHEDYDDWSVNNDVAVLHITSTFVYGLTVAPGSIAGTNYNLGDGVEVWAIGWGTTATGIWASSSEELRHVQIWTVNQEICRERYGSVLTDDMLCSGWLDVGGRDQCQGDSGGPLLHNGVIVGICSWGRGCAQARFPGVNARVSSYTTWIVANA